MPQIGEMIREYRLEAFVGKGGMATVWKARQTLLDQVRAMKVMSEVLAADEGFGQRFRAEAQNMARLDHPNVLSILEFFVERGQHCIVMPFIDGEPLEACLRRSGPMAAPDAARFALPILNALDFAHERGLVHRDVKPSNILLDRAGKPLLSDFGIALMLGEERRTRTGASIGTPHYMSPEQIFRPRLVDRRSDVYSFGCVLYEMLAGRPPFIQEEGESTETVMLKHETRPVEPPGRWNPGILPGVEAVVLRALAKKPDERFPTCAEFARALAREARTAPRHDGATIEKPTTALAATVVTPPRLQTPPAAGLACPPPGPAPAMAPPFPVGPPLSLTPPPPPKTVTAAYVPPPPAAGPAALDPRAGPSVHPGVPAMVNRPSPAPLIGGGPPGTTVSTPVPFPAGRSRVKALAWAAAALAIVLGFVVYAVFRPGGQAGAPATPRGAAVTNTAVPAAGPADGATPSPEPGKAFRNSLGMVFVWVGAGSFTMGSAEDPNEGPAHAVRLTKPYFLQTTEVTVDEFRQFAQAAGYRSEAEVSGTGFASNGKDWVPTAGVSWQSPGFTQSGRDPVVCVTWNDARAFCEWLSRKEGRVYRLPTEAEWEFACRTGAPTRWPFAGDESQLPAYAWYTANAQGRTHPVGSLKANTWGFHDMLGNAWEWCGDFYTDVYPSDQPATDPAGPATGDRRAIRGGGWADGPSDLRPATRWGLPPTDPDNDTGFRLVLVP